MLDMVDANQALPPVLRPLSNQRSQLSQSGHLAAHWHRPESENPAADDSREPSQPESHITLSQSG